jgi:hypothetical protein
MMSKSRTTSIFPFFLMIFIISGRPALAYIDPGTGSYMLQMAIAFFIGALFTVKIFWKKIIVFFRATFSKKKKDSDNPL